RPQEPPNGASEQPIAGAPGRAGSRKGRLAAYASAARAHGGQRRTWRHRSFGGVDHPVRPEPAGAGSRVLLPREEQQGPVPVIVIVAPKASIELRNASGDAARPRMIRWSCLRDAEPGLVALPS